MQDGRAQQAASPAMGRAEDAVAERLVAATARERYCDARAVDVVPQLVGLRVAGAESRGQRLVSPRKRCAGARCHAPRRPKEPGRSPLLLQHALGALLQALQVTPSVAEEIESGRIPLLVKWKGS